MNHADEPHPPKPLPWHKATSGHANRLVESFKVNLKSVAQTFAEHERVDSVSVKHVDESYAALVRLGLHSKTIWQRSDTWTGLGAFLVGVSFSMPDVCSATCTFLGWSDKTAGVLSVSTGILAFAIGLALFFWARYQGGVPKKPGVA